MVKIEFNLTRRHLSGIVAFVAVLALVVPTASWAADRFKDVPDSNIFHDDIAWLAAAGVTKGCNPPANDEFCPGDNVRRETMAAFMHRLAVNEVVNAATALTADDAGMLDGLDSSELFVHGPVQTNHIEWHPTTGEPAEPVLFNRLRAGNIAVEDGVVGMQLSFPRSIGGSDYSLTKVTYCGHFSATAFVTAVGLVPWEAGTGGPITWDFTERNSNGCYDFDVDLPGGVYWFEVEIAGTSAAQLRDVTAVWEPGQ